MEKISVLKKLQEDLLNCQMCTKSYKDPRQLPCQHIICWECLLSYVTQSEVRNNTFPCPICKDTIQIPSEGLQNMNKCLIIGQIKDALSIADISFNTCESKDDIDIYLCMECSSNICSKYVVWHSERAHKRDLKMSYIEKRISEFESVMKENGVLTNNLLETEQSQMSNQQKIMSNQQKIISDQQKIISNQQKIMSEQECAKKHLQNSHAAETRLLNKTLEKCSRIEAIQQESKTDFTKKITDCKETLTKAVSNIRAATTNPMNAEMKRDIDKILLNVDSVKASLIKRISKCEGIIDDNAYRTNGLLRHVQTHVKQCVCNQETWTKQLQNARAKGDERLNDVLKKCSNIESVQQLSLNDFRDKISHYGKTLSNVASLKESVIKRLSMCEDMIEENDVIIQNSLRDVQTQVKQCLCNLHALEKQFQTDQDKINEGLNKVLQKYSSIESDIGTKITDCKETLSLVITDVRLAVDSMMKKHTGNIVSYVGCVNQAVTSVKSEHQSLKKELYTWQVNAEDSVKELRQENTENLRELRQGNRENFTEITRKLNQISNGMSDFESRMNNTIQKEKESFLFVFIVCMVVFLAITIICSR